MEASAGVVTKVTRSHTRSQSLRCWAPGEGLRTAASLPGRGARTAVTAQTEENQDTQKCHSIKILQS